MGEGALTEAVVRELRERGAKPTWLHHPSDVEFAEVLDERPAAVAVVTRDDAWALRLALLAAHKHPDARLVVTIFDRTVAAQLRLAIPECVVVSMADLVAPSFAAPCLSDDALAVLRGAEGLEALHMAGASIVRRPHPAARRRARRALADRLAGILRPFDLSARLLVGGLVGLAAMLAADFAIGLVVLDESLIEALFLASRTLATVGPNEALTGAAEWVRVVATVTMLGALASSALFAAGLVNRLLEPRHVGIAGRRAIPRRDHVVIAGMGQVGLRLALLLRDSGVPVVGIERNPRAVGVRHGRRYGLPIVVAEAGDREVLDRLALDRARALAAVTSDDVTNVAIALAARAVHPAMRIVLRAGDGEIAAESRSLLHLGDVRDAHRIAATGIAATALGWEPGAVVLDADGETRCVPPADLEGMPPDPPPASVSSPTGERRP